MGVPHLRKWLREGSLRAGRWWRSTGQGRGRREAGELAGGKKKVCGLGESGKRARVDCRREEDGAARRSAREQAICGCDWMQSGGGRVRLAAAVLCEVGWRRLGLSRGRAGRGVWRAAAHQRWRLGMAQALLNFIIGIGCEMHALIRID